MVKVEVTDADNRYREWTEPFIGEYVGSVKGGDGPYAIVIHPDGRFLLVVFHLLRKVDE